MSIDLRDDWPTALRAAGFTDGAPTAWLAEGLLIYLPSEAQDRLFDNTTALSAPGSTIATEYVPALKDFDVDKAREAAERFRDHGVDIDMPSLIYHGERTHVIDYLTSKGWQMSTTPRTELFAQNDIPLPDGGNEDPLGEIVYVSGTLDG